MLGMFFKMRIGIKDRNLLLKDIVSFSISCIHIVSSKKRLFLQENKRDIFVKIMNCQISNFGFRLSRGHLIKSP